MAGCQPLAGASASMAQAVFHIAMDMQVKMAMSATLKRHPTIRQHFGLLLQDD
jgi:hypothetical protein